MVIRSLGALDIEGVEQAIGEFFANLRNGGEKNIDQVMLILNQLLSSILKELLEYDTKLFRYFGHDFNLYAAMDELETIGEVEKWIRELLRTIVEKRSSIGTSGNEYGHAMAEYIRLARGQPPENSRPSSERHLHASHRRRS